MKKKTTEEFILEANLIHKNKYNYSLVKYTANNIKISIICSLHGEFKQSPSKHLSNQGCPKCSIKKVHDSQRKVFDDFKSKANLIHDNKYSYNSTDYVNNRTKIIITCPIHGEFKQIPSNHLRGKGCLYCGGTSKMDINSFIMKANEIHDNKYDYNLTEYVNSSDKVIITCPKHGDFKQTPNNHISKQQGCYECLGKIFNTETFIEHCLNIHENKYDYSLVDYKRITDEVIIICPIHGEFTQRCDSHREGNGCKKCSNNGVSKYEKEINEFLISNNIVTEINDKTVLNGLEIDIYIPSHKVAIEFDGLYWHSEEYKPSNYHLNKTELCEQQGIQLIHIFEDEWLNKPEIVKSRLVNILGLTPIKLYGRKTEVRKVSPKDSKLFLDTNHIQGSVNSKVKLGLYNNDELVSIMTFGGLRKILGSTPNNDEYELLRFCNKLNTTVIGGADKLLKHFTKTHSPNKIISYADRRWSQGGLYEKLGFSFIHNSKPNYFYLVNKNREHRFKYRKDILIREGFDANKSEHQIMLDRNIYRIYDCGAKKYIL